MRCVAGAFVALPSFSLRHCYPRMEAYAPRTALRCRSHLLSILSESKFGLRNCPYKKEARLFEPHCNSDSKDNSLAIADVNVIAAEQLIGPLRWRNKN